MCFANLLGFEHSTSHRPPHLRGALPQHIEYAGRSAGYNKFIDHQPLHAGALKKGVAERTA